MIGRVTRYPANCISGQGESAMKRSANSIGANGHCNPVLSRIDQRRARRHWAARAAAIGSACARVFLAMPKATVAADKLLLGNANAQTWESTTSWIGGVLPTTTDDVIINTGSSIST